MSVVGIVMFPEFQLLDVAGPLELFAATDGIEPVLLADSTEPVAPANFPQHRLLPAFDFAHAPTIDALVVPGGPGIRHAIANRALLDFVQTQGQKAAFVTSVCTGALVLGAAKLLVGYRATTHWRYTALLKSLGAIPTEGRVVRDRNRITAGGVTAGIDFGLELASVLVGERQAQKAQLRLEYNPAPPFRSGHPTEAPSDIVDEVHLETTGVYAERERLLRSHAHLTE